MHACKSREFASVCLLMLLSLSIVGNLMLASNLIPSGYGSQTEIGGTRTTLSNSFKSIITVPAMQNLTFPASNASTIEVPSQASPMNASALAIDVVGGFEPTQRFNYAFDTTMIRAYNAIDAALRMANNGLSLSYNTSGYPSYVIYGLTFADSYTVSITDFVSLGLSTGSSFNSTQALIGVSLMLRDLQGDRYYVSIVVSNQYLSDEFGLSEWFLGAGFAPELPKYPYYSMRYGSQSGSWFKQLSLSRSLEVLNLSSAYLDGLLVGAEIGYTGAPLGPYSMTEVETTFHFALVHSLPFSINEQPVNSTLMTFPYQTRLSFSGILRRSVNVTIEGFLKPTRDNVELFNNWIVSKREVFFDIQRATDAGVSFRAGVNITVFSKDVRNCLVTVNNDTTVDLTDALLSNSKVVYAFSKGTTTLRVLLILYRFNAWVFSFNFLSAVSMTKIGIVDEQFSPVENKGLIVVNATVDENTRLAIKTDGLTISALSVDGVENSLESILIVGEESFFVIPLTKSGESYSFHTIRYLLSDSPLYESLTVTPFEVHFNGSVFNIFTPLNVEDQLGSYVPITVQMLTYRTFILRVDYDPSFFEAVQEEVMAYSDRFHYEYFALKPLQTGRSTVSLRIAEASSEESFFSTLFSFRVSNSSFLQVLLYSALSITLVSFVVAFEGRSLAKWMRHRGGTSSHRTDS